MEASAGRDGDGPHWSPDVHAADWIGPRLTSWDEDGFPVTVVVPGGFEAYARVLHPAGTADDSDRPVRWAEVAAWSGRPLRPDAQFHSVALPPADPGRPYPFHGQGPEEGNLGESDCAVLAAIVRDWTATPEDCWFAVWEGYGWEGTVSFFAVSDSDEGGPAVPPPPRDPVPAPVRAGPRVELPNRGYLLYRGPAEDALALPRLAGTHGQCPNLWWPADRAWCVATEIDLPWTYVGGPRGLIDAVLADERIEALPAAPGDPVDRVEDWVAVWVAGLFESVMAAGTASLSTPRGTVTARLRMPGRLRRGEIRIEVTRPDGGSSSSWSALGGDEDRVRRSVEVSLTQAVLGLSN